MKFKTNQNTETIIIDLFTRISAQTELCKNGFQSSPKALHWIHMNYYTGDKDSSGFLSHGIVLYFVFPSHVYFTSLTSHISPFSSLIFLIYVFLTNFSSSVQAISSPTSSVRRLLKKDAKVLPATKTKG